VFVSSNARKIPAEVLSHPAVASLIDRATPTGRVTPEEVRQATEQAAVEARHLKALLAHLSTLGISVDLGAPGMKAAAATSTTKKTATAKTAAKKTAAGKPAAADEDAGDASTATEGDADVTDLEEVELEDIEIEVDAAATGDETDDAGAWSVRTARRCCRTSRTTSSRRTSRPTRRSPRTRRRPPSSSRRPTTPTSPSSR